MAIRRRKKPNLVLPLSSMGDIAFLLIIFFMLASNFMKTGNVDLQRPGAPTLEQQEPAKCSVMVDRDGVVWCDGAQVSAGELASAQGLEARRIHARRRGRKRKRGKDSFDRRTGGLSHGKTR